MWFISSFEFLKFKFYHAQNGQVWKRLYSLGDCCATLEIWKFTKKWIIQSKNWQRSYFRRYCHSGGQSTDDIASSEFCVENALAPKTPFYPTSTIKSITRENDYFQDCERFSCRAQQRRKHRRSLQICIVDHEPWRHKFAKEFCNGFGINNHTRRSQGRSAKGDRVYRTVNAQKGPNVTICCAVSTEDLLHYQVIQGGIKKEILKNFLEFLCGIIILDEANDADEFCILDNAPRHRGIEDMDLSGIFPLKMVPKYSPFLTLSEAAISCWKAAMKREMQEERESGEGNYSFGFEEIMFLDKLLIAVCRCKLKPHIFFIRTVIVTFLECLNMWVRTIRVQLKVLDSKSFVCFMQGS